MVPIKSVLLSPPIAMLVFMLLAVGISLLGHRIATKGKNEPSKFLSYTGGQSLQAPKRNVRYEAFFRLALMFAILHVAGLVISTLPFSNTYLWPALFLIFGISVSILVLVDVG